MNIEWDKERRQQNLSLVNSFMNKIILIQNLFVYFRRKKEILYRLCRLNKILCFMISFIRHLLNNAMPRYNASPVK